MHNDEDTTRFREIELLDEDLEPIAAGGGGGIATNPGELNSFPKNPVLQPIGPFQEPILRDPLQKVGGGVNRGFPGRNPEAEDIEAVVTVKWSNK
jgi:hypothetical protein